MTDSSLTDPSSNRQLYFSPGVAGTVTTVGPGSGDSTRLDPRHFEALRLETRALRHLSAEASARARATRDQIRRGRERREILHESAFARLQAKHETMPVIEQAKGVIMCQHGCGPEEAFDLLRRASQRANIKVHVLAAQVVEQAISRNNASNVAPISAGATRHRQARTQHGHDPAEPRRPSGGERPADRG